MPEDHPDIASCGGCHANGCGTEGHCGAGNCFACHDCLTFPLDHVDLSLCAGCHSRASGCGGGPAPP
ncbi:hypothetical protein G3N55_10105 [Dissulfurirhabdus thermomarina]|uniref:Uncharacterized protein n=1 Tax=Dissulfurirhabdus thermomarina TaxID=1765737 RepID=A0A6N9TPI8_DISTH|nr:hypothetical protein [Dissulfurirhabdus thermomarina]NDY43191.1 hypothetical protein [Dissulfurirhabdus thermomarina]NMX24501.1 hypothetical protein [Dissulfurirhabdus thermomarina]